MAAYSRLDAQRNPDHYESVQQSHETSRCCTKAKAQRVALHIFEKTAYAGAGALLFIGITQVLPISFWAAFSISLLLCAGADACKDARKKIHDFDDPEEFQCLQLEANRSTYAELRRNYTWVEMEKLLPAGKLEQKGHLDILEHFDSYGKAEIASFLQRNMITPDQYRLIIAKNRDAYENSILPAEVAPEV